MGGTCIATVKIIGVSSLGLLSSSLAYQATRGIPLILDNLKIRISALADMDILATIKQLIYIARATYLTLGSLASGLLALAYRASPISEKHPYLIYLALGAPLAILSALYKGYNEEKSLIHRARGGENLRSRKGKKQTKNKNDEDESEEPKGDDSLIGRSYIHISDEESSVTSTPGGSTPNSPRTNSVDSLEHELSIQEEIENSIAKKEVIRNLEGLRGGYLLGTYVSGFAFLLGAIGLIGDYFLL